MVDIVNGSLGVDELNEVLDNLDDILLGQHTDIHLGIQAELLVDTVAAYITQVIALVREEQVLDDLTGTGIIGRISITQLTIDVEHSFLLRVRGILLQRVEDDRVVLRY